MKTPTFKDLIFEPHPIANGLQAKHFFKNGYGCSVVRFKIGQSYGSYTSNEQEWELAIIKGDNESFKIVYDTPITDDVMGHLNEKQVSNIMKKISKLPK